jgi:hypothetical protein
MGAESFYNRKSARTAGEAFDSLQRQALEECGNRGYTGTIAEKCGFEMVPLLADETLNACVERCWEDAKHFVHDSCNPAACIDCGPDPKQPGLRVFYFFGMAIC